LFPNGYKILNNFNRTALILSKNEKGVANKKIGIFEKILNN